DALSPLPGEEQAAPLAPAKPAAELAAWRRAGPFDGLRRSVPANDERQSMGDIVITALMQLLGQSPVLVVYLVGMILALVFWRRYPGPCLLVLLATGFLLVVTVAQTFVAQYLMRARADLDWNHEQLGWMLSVIALTGSILRAIGFGLLLVAVFLGRGVARRDGSNEALQPTGPAPRSFEEQSITSRPGG